MVRVATSLAIRLAGALVASATLLSACATGESASLDALIMPSLAVPAPHVGSIVSTSAKEGASSPAAGGAGDAFAVAASSPRDVGAAGRPDPAEVDYAQATAAGIFRRRTSQRSTSFVPVEGPGYGLCLRAPAKSGRGYDHALIVFSRRLNGTPISQVDDDIIVYRRAADAAPCRRAGIEWMRLVG